MTQQYKYVNWMDGMKINKDHFVQTDHANRFQILQSTSILASPLRYGVLPEDKGAGNTFSVQLAVDNQNTLRVHIQSLEAITPGGYRLSIQANAGQQEDGVNSFIFPFTKPETQVTWWVAIISKPFVLQPYGAIDPAENPPRLPFVNAGYEVQLLTAGTYEQYAKNPAALIIGKILAGPNEVLVEQEYIPPCFAVNAHPDLAALCAELESFYGSLEQKCIVIVQKIFTRNQQNELSELVQFVCDRILLYLGQSLTQIKWMMMHSSPADLFAAVASLARVMKNSMDLRLGSGKEEMMNYIIEWSELKQGELDALLTEMATMRFNNNDINDNINRIITFVGTISKLFDTLSKLEFIGKKKETGYFVNEAASAPAVSSASVDANKPRRRFFG